MKNKKSLPFALALATFLVPSCLFAQQAGLQNLKGCNALAQLKEIQSIDRKESELTKKRELSANETAAFRQVCSNYERTKSPEDKARGLQAKARIEKFAQDFGKMATDLSTEIRQATVPVLALKEETCLKELREDAKNIDTIVQSEMTRIEGSCTGELKAAAPSYR